LDQNNISYEINLNKYNWLANCELDLIDTLIANKNEDKCQIIISKNAYETRKKWMQRTKDEKYKYPCVYTVNSKSEITFPSQ
jgi:hypothetical protein